MVMSMPLPVQRLATGSQIVVTWMFLACVRSQQQAISHAITFVSSCLMCTRNWQDAIPRSDNRQAQYLDRKGNGRGHTSVQCDRSLGRQHARASVNCLALPCQIVANSTRARAQRLAAH